MAVADTPEREHPNFRKPSQAPVAADVSPKDQAILKALAEHDIFHLPLLVADGVRRMLKKHDARWTGRALRTMGATRHRFYLV